MSIFDWFKPSPDTGYVHKPVHPRQSDGALKPKQIAWLDKKLKDFAYFREQADKAKAHTDKTRATMPAPGSQ